MNQGDIVNGMTRQEWNIVQRERYYERKKRYKEQGLNSVGKPYKNTPPRKRGKKKGDSTKPKRNDFKTFQEFDNALWQWQKKKAEESYAQRMEEKKQAIKNLIRQRKQQLKD